MKLLFVHSHIFKYDNNNNFYSDGKLTYQMWENRYLKYFSSMTVAGRGSKIGNEILNISSGPNVNHHILPNLSKIKKRLHGIKSLKLELYRLIEDSDVVVARMPSGHAYHAIKIAKDLKKPYVIEVVGDTFAALWTHGSIWGKILAPINYIMYKKIIKQSSHVIYVTQGFLQEKYPPASNANVINISNVDISSVPIQILEKKIERISSLSKSEEIKIGLIGSYSSKYKGIDTAIRSIKILNDRGLNCKLIVLGDGDNSQLKKLALKLNLESKVVFWGSLPGGEKVFEWLDTLDIYIQPSLTEGLPRALIEAMSRGLPCVGSSAGGIPELIEETFIHRPKSAVELSGKIEHLLSNDMAMIEQAKRNYSYARKYTAEVLDEKRKEFWLKFIEEELNDS